MSKQVPELRYGPYTPPALGKGDHATCLFRDGEVVITSWSDAPLSWPRCRRVGHREGSGLLVNDELLRAILRESCLALQHWFGVSAETVWRWRLALGVIRLGPPGSERLLFLFREPGPATLRGQKVPLNFVRLRIYRRGKEEGKRRKQKKKGVGSR